MSSQGLRDLNHALRPVLLRVEHVTLGHVVLDRGRAFDLQLSDQSVCLLAEGLSNGVQEDEDHITVFGDPFVHFCYVELVPKIPVCETGRVNEYDLFEVADPTCACFD